MRSSFGGDNAPVDATTELAQGVDVLQHMCHFVSGAVAGPRLTVSSSGHLGAARRARDAGEIFKRSTVFAEDLLQMPLKMLQLEIYAKRTIGLWDSVLWE